VLGFWQQLPRLRFVGKAGHISDWFGEKLEEQFVASLLEQIFNRHSLSPVFAMLAPEDDAGFRYVYTSKAICDLTHLHSGPDSALRANFNYDYCRKLEQIHSATVVCITHGAESYLRACQLRGQKLGNVKPLVLQKTQGWDSYFDKLENYL
jgi:hypothetical protein